MGNNPWWSLSVAPLKVTNLSGELARYFHNPASRFSQEMESFTGGMLWGGQVWGVIPNHPLSFLSSWWFQPI